MGNSELTPDENSGNPNSELELESGGDRESILVDLSGVPLTEVLADDGSPLVESLRRVLNEADGDAVAGFSDGVS